MKFCARQGCALDALGKRACRVGVLYVFGICGALENVAENFVGLFLALDVKEGGKLQYIAILGEKASKRGVEKPGVAGESLVGVVGIVFCEKFPCRLYRSATLGLIKRACGGNVNFYDRVAFFDVFW